VIGFIAFVFGTVNIVGGFMVTDRMLEMFGTRKKKPESDSAAAESPPVSTDKEAGE
jgi:NAD(P) transhydrogenase subunit alpha